MAKFWSQHDVVYGKDAKNLIKLQTGKGFIRRRSRLAVLRYYLAYENTEDFSRGLLILFHPFRNEVSDIHQHDVKTLVLNNWKNIEETRSKFEANKVMTDIVNDIQKSNDEDNMAEDDEEEVSNEEFDPSMAESTLEEEIDDFDKWAKKKAVKQLESVKQ